MDQLSAYGEADRPQSSPPKEFGQVEDTNKDTSFTPDLAQGVLPWTSTSVSTNPARSEPSRQDAPSHASQPIPEGSQDSSRLLPPPPPEEPYDSYLHRVGRAKEDLRHADPTVRRGGAALGLGIIA